MHLCDDGHDEVCYDGRKCPVCEKIEEVKAEEGISEALRDKVEDLKTQIAELKEA